MRGPPLLSLLFLPSCHMIGSRQNGLSVSSDPSQEEYRSSIGEDHIQIYVMKCLECKLKLFHFQLVWQKCSPILTSARLRIALSWTPCLSLGLNGVWPSRSNCPALWDLHTVWTWLKNQAMFSKLCWLLKTSSASPVFFLTNQFCEQFCKTPWEFSPVWNLWLKKLQFHF